MKRANVMMGPHFLFGENMIRCKGVLLTGMVIQDTENIEKWQTILELKGKIIKRVVHLPETG